MPNKSADWTFDGTEINPSNIQLLKPGGEKATPAFWSAAGDAFVHPVTGEAVDLVNKLSSPVVLYDGDSITARALSPDFPADNTTAHSGFNFHGYMTWERAMLGCCYEVENQGVSGETIEQITTRLLATDFSSYAVISLMCGTNNVLGSTTADVAADIALIGAVVERAQDYSRPLRIFTVPPRDTGSWTAGEMAYALALNTAIRKLPLTYPHVFVADTYLALQDANTDPDAITGLLTDTTHPGKKGAFRIAKYCGADSMTAALQYAGYSRVLEARRPFVDASYTELLTNTDFKTQTGGTNSIAGVLTTGAVPSGWRLLNNGSATDVKIYYPFYVPDATRQRGMWAASVAYVVGDAVTESGAAYICTAAHTSATFATELAAGSWKRVWVTDYCWQLTVTGDAADDGVTIQRASDIGQNHDDVFMGVCGLATEGEVEKVKICKMYLEQWNAASFGTQRAHYNNTLYPANGLSEEAIASRIQGVFATSRQAPFTAYTGTLGINQFKIEFTLTAAGTASLIIFAPSMRKY